MTDSFSLIYTPVFILSSSTLPCLLFIWTLTCICAYFPEDPLLLFCSCFAHLSSMSSLLRARGDRSHDTRVMWMLGGHLVKCYTVFLFPCQCGCYWYFFKCCEWKDNPFPNNNNIHNNNSLDSMDWVVLEFIPLNNMERMFGEKKKTLSVYFYIWCNIENVLYSGAENDPVLFSVNLNGFKKKGYLCLQLIMWYKSQFLTVAVKNINKNYTYK